MSEKIYDEEIAPELLKLAVRCREADISFVALVEYEPNKVASTATITESPSLELMFTVIAARCRANLDLLVIHILKYCNTNNIDTSQTMIGELIRKRQ